MFQVNNFLKRVRYGYVFEDLKDGFRLCAMSASIWLCLLTFHSEDNYVTEGYTEAFFTTLTYPDYRNLP